MSNQSDQSVVTCKVVLLGESGVGKTSIISRYLTNNFNSNYISTHAANYTTKSLTYDEYNGRSVKFNIWDTAGQEKFRSLNKIFYKDASIAILVYDITRKDSFDQLTEYWHKALQENAQKNISIFIFILNIVIGIAANKCDLFGDEAVEEKVARQFAKNIGAIFKYTSASTSSGIEEMFNYLGKKLLDPKLTESSSSEEENKDHQTNNNNDENKKIDLVQSDSKKHKKKKWC